MKKLICLGLLFFSLTSFAQNVKISDMPAASSLTGTELVPVVQSGINKKATVSQFVSGYVPTSRTITINGTTYDLSTNRSWAVGNVFTTGIYANPSWITSLAASKLTGTVAIANGGTGQTTANTAFNALAPSQATHSGKYLTTDGTNTSWATVASGGSWGSITGTLSDQTDLQTALDNRWNFASASTQTWSANQTYAGSSSNRLTFNFATLGANSGVTINSTATDAASNTQKALEVLQSGANGTASQTTYGVYIDNTKTGTTGTNIGLFSKSSGGATNYSAYFATSAAADANLVLPNSAGIATGSFRFINGQRLDFRNNVGRLGYLGTLDNSGGVSNINLTIESGEFQITGNATTTGNLINASSISVTTGPIAKFTSTSTVVNHVAGTNAHVTVASSGANSTSSKTAVGVQSLVTNTGTSSTNYGGYFSASGATTNVSGYFRSPNADWSILAESTNGNDVVSGAIGMSRGLMLSSNIGSAIYHYRNSTSGYDQFVIGVSESVKPTTYSQAKIVVQANGTVGIGVTAPVAVLDIAQSALNVGATAYVKALKITPGAHINLTAATEFVFNDYLGATQTWADGTVATQRFAYFRAFTLNKTTTAATFTDTYRAYFEKSTAGAGVTLTNNYAAGFDGDINMVSTTSAIKLNGSAGTSGQVLTSQGAGATPTWTTVSGGGITVGTTTITSGTSTRVPYNDGGVYGEDAGFTYDETNDALTVDAMRIFSIGSRGTFVGDGAGNFTLSGNFNTGIGYQVLDALTTGGGNVAIGNDVLGALTEGNDNTVIGQQAAINLTTGDNNVVIGASASSLTTGDNNIIIGQSAATVSSLSGSGNIVIGYDVDIQSPTTSGQLVIQNIIFGTGNSGTGSTLSTGSIGIGTGAPDRRFHIEADNAATNTVTYLQRLTSTSSGTPAAGIGGGVEYEVETAAGNNEIVVSVDAAASDVTSTTEAGNYVVNVMDRGSITNKNRFALMGKLVTLTESTATQFAQIIIASGEIVGGEIEVTVEANDATDYQARTLRAVFTAVNKAGTLTMTLGTPTEVVAVSAGTLTVTLTVTDGGSGVMQFKADAASSLTQTTLRAQSFIIKNFGSAITN